MIKLKGSPETLRAGLLVVLKRKGQNMVKASREMGVAYNTLRFFIREGRYPNTRSFKKMSDWLYSKTVPNQQN